MDTATPEFGITVTATDRESMNLELDTAVAKVRDQAIRDGSRGILVTRHEHGSFTVALSDEVPFGLTHERDSRN